MLAGIEQIPIAVRHVKADRCAMCYEFDLLLIELLPAPSK